LATSKWEVVYTDPAAQYSNGSESILSQYLTTENMVTYSLNRQAMTPSKLDGYSCYLIRATALILTSLNIHDLSLETVAYNNL
jgi:hypothetical protein